jgi:hypothetical protein
MSEVESWIKAYESRESATSMPLDDTYMYPRVPKILESTPIQEVGSIYEYQGHRTTKQGSLVLSFVNIETEEEAVAFFNVDVRRQRGINKGDSYRTGQGGQFLPLPRSNFRKFWLETIGESPRRWASVHKELKPKLCRMLFTGCPEIAKKCDGRNYIRLKNLRLVERKGNEMETAKEQYCDKFGTADCNKEARVVPANKGFPDGGSTLQSNRTKTLINVNTEHTKTHKDNPSPECPKCLGEGCHMCWIAVQNL